jgi:transcription antitermination factor NusG
LAVLDAKWYVAQLKSGHERLAINGLNEQGFQSYYPQMQVTRARNGRWIDAPEPVFPLYLFLRSLPDPASWRSARNTRGVVRLLGNNAPCALRGGEVEQLQLREKLGLLRHSQRRQVRAGDVVEFRCGTFVGLQGICQWTRRERIGVLLQILGGPNVIVSPRDWLKLAVA